MRIALRALAILIAMAFVVPFVAFVGYDLFAFQTRRAQIDELIMRATSDERSLSPDVMHLISVSTGGHPAVNASRVILQELKVQNIIQGGLGWHMTSALWWLLTNMHLSEQEQFTLIASCSYMGSQRYGFSAEANARFYKPLSQLSLEEKATLVALTHAPSTYIQSPQRLAQRREWLVSQVLNSSRSGNGVLQ